MDTTLKNNKTKLKLFIKKWSQKFGVYKQVVALLGLSRGIQLKIDSDKHRAKRKNAIKITPTKKTDRLPNIVFLVIDSLRYDHVSYQGYAQKTTPFLDSLKGDALVGMNHYTCAPWTWPTVNSLLTGLYPHSHGAVISEDLKGFNRLNFPAHLPYETPTVVDVLEQLGYVARFYSGVVTADIALKGVFERSIHDQVKWEDVPCEYLFNKTKMTFKQNPNKPVFVYIQPGDLHMPISVPNKYIDPSADTDWGRLDYIEYMDGMNLETFKSERKKYYDAALTYVDDQVKNLVETAKKDGWYENTVFIVTADHGEELWDHVDLEERLFTKHRPHLLGSEHGYSLFEEMIHVPLMIFGGPIKENKRITTNTNHVDLVPTILDLCQISVNTKMEGQSMTQQSTEATRIIFAEECGYGYEQKAAIGAKYKYIRSEGYGFELYEDLASKEIFEIKDQQEIPQPIEALRDALDTFVSAKKQSGVQADADAAVRKRLEDLGYM